MFSELDLLLDVARRLEDTGLDYMLTGSSARKTLSSPNSTGPGNSKDKGNSPMWKISSPQEPATTTC
jgi:hypothetical protein